MRKSSERNSSGPSSLWKPVKKIFEFDIITKNYAIEAFESCQNFYTVFYVVVALLGGQFVTHLLAL